MKKQNGLIAAAVAAALSAPVANAAEITISGAVEVEASSVTDKISSFPAEEKSADIVVATAAIGVEAVVNDRVSATVNFLYEEDDTPFDVDEGYVTLKANDTTSVVAGRMFVPFGSFESNMVSDPMTLDLGETGETAIMIAMESGNASGSVYMFNGDSYELTAAHDDEFSFGANIAYATDNMGFGVSYISNIADSDMLQSVESGAPATVGGVKSAVAGMGVNFGYSAGNFSVIAEHVAAMDDFVAGDLDGVITAKSAPTASNVEVAFDTGRAVVALAYQMTDEALEIGLPETRASIAVSFDVMEGASMGIEYATADDYSTADNGTGESASAFTVQLAVEF